MGLETVFFVFLGNEQIFRRKKYIVFVYLLKSTSLQKKSDFDLFELCHESAILVDFCMDSLLTVVDSGDVYFSDVDARKVGRLTGGVNAEYVIGFGKDDGCQKTASFVQPTCICAEGNSLYITDTGAGALKLISPTGAIANFLQQVRTLYSSHGIHSSPVPIYSNIREVHDVPSVLQYAHQFPAAVEETVKRTTQCGFNYFTNLRSYYEVPDGMVSFGDLPKLPRPPKHPGTTQ